MQFQSDILGIPLSVGAVEGLSGMGAAWCAAIGAGLADRTTLFAGKERTAIWPRMPEEERLRRLSGWRQAIDQLNR